MGAKMNFDTINLFIDGYEKRCRRKGMNKDDIARSLGLSYTTLQSRKKNPKKFGINELYNIAKVVGTDFFTLIGEKRK